MSARRHGFISGEPRYLSMSSISLLITVRHGSDFAYDKSVYSSDGEWKQHQESSDIKLIRIFLSVKTTTLTILPSHTERSSKSYTHWDVVSEFWLVILLCPSSLTNRRSYSDWWSSDRNGIISFFSFLHFLLTTISSVTMELQRRFKTLAWILSYCSKLMSAH